MGRALAGDIRFRRRILTPLLAISALLALPALAGASTVAFSHLVNSEGQNEETLSYQAAPGEANRLVLSVAAADGTELAILVHDPGAAIEAGAGCSGGGAAGDDAICPMQAPRHPAEEYCGHDCFNWVRESGWKATIRVDLGDGGDSLDSTGLHSVAGPRFAESAQPFELAVQGGAGNDTIATSDGNDLVEPGPGDDTVDTGAGSDTVKTSPPDGNDVYDLGESGLLGGDLVTYAGSSTPIELSGSIVKTGDEEDRLSNFDELIGGEGDDILRPGPGPRMISGGGGNDLIDGAEGLPRQSNSHKLVLVGGDGADRIFGGEGDDVLSGGPGDDHLDGRGGDDELREGAYVGEPAGGSDTAIGGSGNDLLELGEGDDTGFGGPGNDEIHGGPGDDALDGGPGDDSLLGEAGSDRLKGGKGDDLLLASRAPQGVKEKHPGPVDTASDLVECGPGQDFASVNPWDRTSLCEEVKLVQVAGILRPRRIGHANRWALPVLVTSAGEVVLSGPQVARTTAAPERKSYGSNPSPIMVPLRPDRRAMARVRRGDRVRLRLSVGFTPEGGVTRRASRSVTLKGAR